MSGLMKSVSGVRGIFGKEMSPEVALRAAAQFGIFCKRGKVIVGRDSRTTGPAMLSAVVSGLMSVGCQVVDLGVVATPTVLLAVEESDAVGGIAITASHNPKDWNAMKFVGQNGMFLYPEAAKEFLSTLDDEPAWAGWDNIGHLISNYVASLSHIKKILAIPYLNLAEIKKHNFTVVVDSVNGAGGIISPALLAELGCDVIELNCNPTGRFDHDPEPLKKNLVQLEQAVKQNRADIGFATDPDVDRLAIVDENGNAIGEELSQLLCAKYVLSRVKGDMVTNLSSSMAAEDVAASFGVNVHRTPVGEINVGKRMKEHKAAIGGEGNGGVICPGVHYTRDAPAGMALILGYLAQTGKKISELAAEIPKYYMIKDKLKLSDNAQAEAIMNRAHTLYPQLQQVTLDGIKFVGDHYWVHIRKSGTEPIIRVITESTTVEHAEVLLKDTLANLQA